MAEPAAVVVVSETKPPFPLNLILHGPPGTGKTWFLQDKVLPYFPNRAEMVTFHPAYRYEEFIEGLRPVADGAGDVRYRVEPGIFRRLADRAAADPAHSFTLLIHSPCSLTR